MNIVLPFIKIFFSKALHFFRYTLQKIQSKTVFVITIVQTNFNVNVLKIKMLHKYYNFIFLFHRLLTIKGNLCKIYCNNYVIFITGERYMGYLKSISKFLVAGALFSSLFVTSAFASNLGKVTGDVVNLRSYNSTAGQLVSVAKKNDVLTIVANANNGWFEVTTADKKKAFISADYVQVVQTDATCIADDVNVRVSPTTASESLGKAKKMQVLVTTGVTGDWCQVKFNDKTGYIHKQFMQGSLLKYLQQVTVSESAPKVDTSNSGTVTENAGQVVAASVAVSDQNAGAYATVNAKSLNMRESAGMDGRIIKSLPEGYNLSIISTTKDWVEVSDDNGTKGFVSAQYIDFKNGTKPANKTENATSAIKNTASTSSSSKLSNKRTYNGKTIDVNELIEYSKQFIGTPYVYGGTDLENGVDCSGFVMSVYKNFGFKRYVFTGYSSSES